MAEFLKKGHVNFSDEVTLATALTQIMKTPKPASPEIELFGVDIPRIREIIAGIKEDGYIAPNWCIRYSSAQAYLWCPNGERL